jgi:diacylglycerol kinase family enzyme
MLAAALPATLSTVFDPPTDAKHIVLCGGDGSYHHLAQLGQQKAVYLVPTGTINLLATLLHNTANPAEIKQAFLQVPLSTPAYQIEMDQHIAMATMNWSFGFDAKVIHALEAKRQGRLAIRLWQAMGFATKQPLTHHQVMIDGQDMGVYQGGFFSLLPSYGHPKFKVYEGSHWVWQGLLFKQEALGQRIGLLAKSIYQPISAQHPTVSGTTIQIAGRPYLQIDGESYGQTTIQAKMALSPLAIVSRKEWL